MSNNINLVFLCGARDYHAMDWYRSAQKEMPSNKLSILTDLIAGEGFKKIISNDDRLEKMIIIDSFLFRKQSSLGNLWRNIIKLLVLPLQIFLLRKHNINNPNSIYYAHSMYYIWLSYLAKVNFIGTPQGSDILIKPFKSWFYRFLSIKSMKAAIFITVDSIKMKNKCEEISGIIPYIIQNGIDLSLILNQNNLTVKSNKRKRIVSIRAFTELYRIKEILLARSKQHPLTFVYPFYDDLYKKEILQFITNSDEDIGRVDRNFMYELLRESIIVISIPYSDSSPRSVYEAIFCGCAVCITYNPYYDLLPKCMKERIIIVDLNNKSWFKDAFEKAKIICEKEFCPDKESLEMFDQRKSFKKILNLLN